MVQCSTPSNPFVPERDHQQHQKDHNALPKRAAIQIDKNEC